MSLFWKIFAWFWGAMVVMGAALFGVVTATQPDPLPAAWRQATSQSLSVYAAQAADSYEKGGQAALTIALRRLRGHGRARLWLFDATGRFLVRDTLDELPSAPPFGGVEASPSEMQRFDRFGQRDGFGPGRGPLPEHVAEQLTTLVKSTLAADNGAAQFDSLGRIVLAAQSVRGPSGRRYALAGEMSRPPGGRAPIESGALLLRLGAVLGTGTLLCYGLARYLTAPVVALRAATRRLAEGDLGARSGGDTNRRRDELADLSRDFDRMAAQIETLMTSERRLGEAQRRLLGDVSHELRSPLTRLNVALALARHHESAPQAHAAHQRIGLEVGRLNDLIGQLLQLSRLESGAATSEGAAQPIDLATLIQEFDTRSRG